MDYPLLPIERVHSVLESTNFKEGKCQSKWRCQSMIVIVKRLDEFGGNRSFGQLNPLVNIVLIGK